jgi:hypothetical protein
MKMDHMPIIPHGKAPHDHSHKMPKEHLKMHEEGGHKHHSEHYKEHAAGHKMHDDHVKAMCGGGYSK